MTIDRQHPSSAGEIEATLDFDPGSNVTEADGTLTGSIRAVSSTVGIELLLTPQVGQPLPVGPSRTSACPDVHAKVGFCGGCPIRVHYEVSASEITDDVPVTVHVEFEAEADFDFGSRAPPGHFTVRESVPPLQATSTSPQAQADLMFAADPTAPVLARYVRVEVDDHAVAQSSVRLASTATRPTKVVLLSDTAGAGSGTASRPPVSRPLGADLAMDPADVTCGERRCHVGFWVVGLESGSATIEVRGTGHPTVQAVDPMIATSSRHDSLLRPTTGGAVTWSYDIHLQASRPGGHSIAFMGWTPGSTSGRTLVAHPVDSMGRASLLEGGTVTAQFLAGPCADEACSQTIPAMVNATDHTSTIPPSEWWVRTFTVDPNGPTLPRTEVHIDAR